MKKINQDVIGGILLPYGMATKMWNSMYSSTSQKIREMEFDLGIPLIESMVAQAIRTENGTA